MCIRDRGGKGLKVLIADDEIKVCRLIQHLVDWDALEMDIVGFANDGKTAYESICEKKPDIVITDIRTVSYTHLDVYKRQFRSSGTDHRGTG